MPLEHEWLGLLRIYSILRECAKTKIGFAHYLLATSRQSEYFIPIAPPNDIGCYTLSVDEIYVCDDVPYLDLSHLFLNIPLFILNLFF